MSYSITSDIKEINERLARNNISYKDKVILVTGGAGFLGSWVCDVLVSQGAYCICLDNLSSGRYENISQLMEKENFRFINHDISKPIFFGLSHHPDGVCVGDIKRIDIVMHMASRASPFEFQQFPIEILKSNTLGTMNALGIAKAHNAILFFTSTSEIYGDVPTSEIPTSEDYNGNVNILSIRAPYDESKRTGEAFCKAYELRHDIRVIIVRIFNTYGPRIKWGKLWGRSVSNFCHSSLLGEPIEIFGTGNQTRSFTYIVDEIEGFLRMISCKEAIGEVMNLGNDNEMTILELAKIIKNLSNSKSEFIFRKIPEGDPKRRCPDLTKIKRIVGWKPSTKVEEGVTKTLKWMKEIVL
ncbi:MAG: GDP-mannose 4,6-dehydratase [Promethearchaeota archaeon]